MTSIRILALGATAFCAACATSTVEPTLDQSLPESYVTNLPAEDTTLSYADWWLGFNDPVLTELVDRAQENNISVAQALLQTDIAQLQRDASQSDLLPTLDAFVNNQLSGVITSGLDGNFTGSTGIGGTFDPDLNGRTAARIASVQAALESSALNANDVRRLITRAIALQYIEFRRASARLALLESTLELQERTLQIVESRYRAGLSPKLDVDRTQADYARTAAQRSQIIAARRQAEFEIQRLMGEPSALDQITNPDRETIPQIQFVSDIGIPADLVRRRPDVRAAEADYRSALALIDAERADLLPSIRIPGQIQAGFGDVSGRSDEIGYSLSALVDIPVFDFGRRQAEVDIQIARTELAALTYRATLLDALQEVEIALVNIEAIQETLEGQLRAVEASQAAYDQLDALYREGLASFIDVLDSQRTLISSRETIVQTEANLAAATVSLLAALDAGCEETGIVACEGE